MDTFSESWYRIANQRVWLRADVIVQRQNYRGERWYVLQNPFTTRYFRLRPAAYEFIARLRPQKTVQEVWQECVDKFPDEAPGQESVLRLLSQLYFANLLHYEQATDSAQLFERWRKGKQRETAMRLTNLMFMRFPLLDPDRFLTRTLPLVGKLISKAGAVLWCGIVALAVKMIIDNFAAVRAQGEGVLAPGNLPLLYLALIVIKTIHEFGHAYFCRKFGGEVHVMGVLLMIFTPVPYMDASASWGFRNRWQRVLVGAAGMIVEVFVAALAVFVWAKTGAGFVHSLAYNIIFIASVSTIVFNANPLLRFDGYYILSDLLEIPNLSTNANRQLRHLWEHYVFGVKQAESPAQSRREAGWLATYGIASGIYRVIVFSGVLLVVADKFLILGLIMVAVCAVSWVILPVGKFLFYLASSSRLDRVRWRATAITAGLAIVLIALLALVPFPHHFRAPGIIEAQQRTAVVNDVAGKVSRIVATPGTRVTQGQPLLELANRELELDLQDTLAQLDEAQSRLRRALSTNNADLKPLQSHLESVTNRLAKLYSDHDALVVRARHDGIWAAPRIRDLVGENIARATPLGMLVNPQSFDFVATVDQADADAVFAKTKTKATGAEVRIRGEAASVVPVAQWTVVPGGQLRLPSAALGWAAGGEVAVAPNEPDKAKELFFEVRAGLPVTKHVSFIHGRSGTIRFDLPPEPLLPRWIRSLQQLLQKRYQL